MKKLVLAALLVFMTASVSALSSNFEDVYEPGVTVIGEVSGGIAGNIEPSQIKLKRGNVELAFSYGVEKLEGRHFVWFVAPQAEENYSLIIEDVVATSGGVTQTEDFQKDFSVVGNLTDYSVSPGAVFASTDFEIEVTLNGDFGQTIDVDFPSARQVALTPGMNTIEFSISEFIGSSLIFISVGKYSIPAFIVGQGEPGDDESVVIPPLPPKDSEIVTEEEREVGFVFSSSVIKSTLLRGMEPEVLSFEIVNTGSDAIFPRFNYNTEILEISPEDGEMIAPGENKSYELVIKDTDDSFREAVIVTSGDFSSYFLVLVDLTADGEDVATEFFNEEEGSIFYSCSELKGSVCGEGEGCSVDLTDTLDGACCLGICEESSSGTYSIAGYVISFVIILILVFVWIKYRKSKSAGGSKVRNRFISAEKNLP